MHLLQDQPSAISDTPLTASDEHWNVRRHIKVRLYDGGYLFEHCEQEPCIVGPEGVATCGRLASPSCGRGNGNLSSWQLACVSPGDHVACDCGYLWVPRPRQRQAHTRGS